MAKIKELKLSREEQNAVIAQLEQPPCMYCKHLLSSGTQRDDADPHKSFRGWTCKAFPTEIPPSLLHRDNDASHLKVDYAQYKRFIYTPIPVEYKDGMGVFTWDGDVVHVDDYKRGEK